MPHFEITDEDGNREMVPAQWERDDFVVALDNNGNPKIYDVENNLDDPPPVGGQWVGETKDGERITEDDMPSNARLVFDENEEEE